MVYHLSAQSCDIGNGAKLKYFIHDKSGKPLALKYSTDGGNSFTTYYYVLNLQGDVVMMLDQDGNVVAEYAYTAWGQLRSASGRMAFTNPLRYRGYYYDSETGFYYLQSRYYDPSLHRFINADAYASTDITNPIASNMFAYCNNNPVTQKDASGNIPNHCVMLTDTGTTPQSIKNSCEFIDYASHNGIKLYHSMNSAAEGWATENRPLSKDSERMAYIYKYQDYYFLSKTYTGMGDFLFLSANVIIPTLFLEGRDALLGGHQVVAQIHTHPLPDVGYHNDFPSTGGIKGGDQIAMTLFGYTEMFIVPYKCCSETPEIIKYTDPSTWCHR